MNNTAAKNTALLGRIVTVQFYNLHTGELRSQDFTMRAFRVSHYNRLIEIFNNEAALVEHALGATKGTVFGGTEEDVTPECYEMLVAAMREVCAGFFAFLERQQPLLEMAMKTPTAPPAPR